MDPSLILALGLLTADYAQTQDIASRPQEYCEGENPRAMGGPHPTRKRVALWFGGVAVATVALHYELPAPWGVRSSYVVAGFEGAAVARNWRIGVGMRF